MSDNLRIWDAVSKTDPKHTKKVNQRGGFTAISAHYQIMEATKQFGPIGEGWGYEAGLPILTEGLIFVPVTLWHGSRDNKFGPMFGGAEWKDGKGRIDSDAAKKATTDGLTKLLSQLGFNADVFLGMFDDNKYVQQVAREFAQQERQPERPRPQPVQREPENPADILAEIEEIAAQFPGMSESMHMLVQQLRQCQTTTAYKSWEDKNLGVIGKLDTPEVNALRAECGAQKERIRSMNQLAA